MQFLLEKNPEVAVASAAAIRSAVENLATHPLIGRRVEGDLRELVISYGATGYIALYRFDIQPTRCACWLCATSERSAIYLEIWSECG